MGSIWEKLRSGAVKSTSNGPVSSSSLLTLSNAVPQFTNAVRAHDMLKDDVKISRIIKYIRKLAVDSAVDESLKGVAGGVLVDKIVKGPKDQSSLDTKINQNNKPGLEVADVVRARIENMHEEANCNEQQMTISTQSIRLLDCFEDLPKEPIKGSNSSNTAPKRIMIRSRL